LELIPAWPQPLAQRHPDQILLAPPIEVELSDESDGEDDHHPHSLAGLYESTRQPYGIPEEDEEEVEEELGHLKDASEKTTVTQRGEPSQEEIQAPTRDETELHTATPSRTSFPLSSFQSMVATAQSRPEDVKQNGHSGFVSTNASASGSHAFTDTTHAPPLPKRMSLALKEHPIFQPSPTMSSTDNAPSQNNSLSSSARTSGPSPASTSPAAPPPNVGNPDQGLQKEKLHPSDWTMEEVVDWLRSKGFDQDVCDRFTGMDFPTGRV
jgi:hypothetical protein